jgi:hypothetical protein
MQGSVDGGSSYRKASPVLTRDNIDEQGQTSMPLVAFEWRPERDHGITPRTAVHIIFLSYAGRGASFCSLLPDAVSIYTSIES